MNRDKALVGSWGEAEAAKYLRKKWYRVTDAHFSSRFGEIDLIAQNWKYIIFVEVKTRKNDLFAQGREFVDRYKQDRIRATASVYLSLYPTKRQPRFDVIEIYAPDGCDTKHPVINHLEDAFQ